MREPGSDLIEAYFKDIRHEVLAPAEVHRLLVKIKAGDLAARDKLIRHNLRLVVGRAVKALKKYHAVAPSFTLLDFIGAGNEGLLVAVDKFDLSYKNKFATYAVWWIDQRMRKLLAQEGRTQHYMEIWHKLQWFRYDFFKVNGTWPSLLEQVRATGLSKEVIAHLTSVMHAYSLDSRSGPQNKGSSKGPEDPGDFEMLTRQHLSQESPEAEALRDLANHQLAKELHEFFLSCSDRDLAILKQRVFAKRDVATLKELGKAFQRTRESIRLYEDSILERLKERARKVWLVHCVKQGATFARALEIYEQGLAPASRTVQPDPLLEAQLVAIESNAAMTSPEPKLKVAVCVSPAITPGEQNVQEPATTKTSAFDLLAQLAKLFKVT